MDYGVGMGEDERYEVVDNSGNSQQILGTVSWNGEQLEWKPQQLRHRFASTIIKVGFRELTLDDGLDFIRAIPQHYRSGYVAVRRVAE